MQGSPDSESAFHNPSVHVVFSSEIMNEKQILPENESVWRHFYSLVFLIQMSVYFCFPNMVK